MKKTNNKAIREPEWLVLLICSIVSILPAVWGCITLAQGASYGIWGIATAVTIMVIAGFIAFFKTQKKDDTDNKASKALIIGSVTAVALVYTLAGVTCWILGPGNTSNGTELETDTTVAPTVEWTIPEYTREQTITVTGKVDGVDVVTVNGETVDVVDGNFTKDIALVEGVNSITVNGETKTVILDTKSPIVEMGDVQLWGTTLYWSGIATDANGCQLFVNGTEVSINGEGEFIARYQLAEGCNTLEVKVVDSAGNETVVEQQFLYGTPELEDRTYTVFPQEEGYLVVGTVNPNWVDVTVNGAHAEIDDNNFSVMVEKPEDGKFVLVFTDKVGNQDIVEIMEPETNEPETNEPETNEPETNEPETNEPETNEPETNEPETNEPETNEPETNEPETNEPETNEPETNEPETNEPETPDEPTLLKKGQELTITTNGHTENLRLIQTDDVCELIIVDDKTVKVIVKEGVTGFAGTITLYDSRSKNGITIMVQA